MIRFLPAKYNPLSILVQIVQTLPKIQGVMVDGKAIHHYPEPRL